MIRCYFFSLYFFIALVCAPHWGLAQGGTETDLLSAAQQAFNDWFSDVATRYLEDFLNKYPQSSNLPTAKLLLGQCDFLRGEYGKALDLFQELSRQTDNRDEVLFWRFPQSCCHRMPTTRGRQAQGLARRRADTAADRPCRLI